MDRVIASPRRTNRWTGATGSEFRIIIGPATLLGHAVARSTPPLYSFFNKRMYRLGQILIAVSLVALTVPAAQDSKSQPKVTTEHTTGNGPSITTIKLEPVLVEHDEATRSYTLLSASVAYAENSANPKLVALSFHSRFPDCRFSDKSGLTLTMDDEQMTVTGVTDKSGNGRLWVFGEREGTLCNESCLVFLTEQTFDRLANSKRVEARLGSATLLLDDVALKALRYFAGRIPKGAVITNRWTGATGSDFRIIIGSAKLLGSAVARSTPPLGFLCLRSN